MNTPTVLLIDGDSDSLTIYSLILEHHGFTVLRAVDGDEGFRMACEHRPTLVVLEPYVPTSGDHPIMELLHLDDRTTGLPVLLVTAVPGLLEGLAREREAGGYLTKPCQPRRFLAEVQRRLEPPILGAA